MPHTTTKSRPGTRWKAEELATLYELAAEGLPLTAVAYQLRARHGRSVAAAYRKIAYLGGVAELRGACQFRTHSLKGAAALLGVDIKTARRWVDRGWLAAGHYRRRRRTERRGGPVMLISDSALHAFLAVEEAWPSYDPARIADPDLRAEAEQLRAAAGGGWRKVTDLMRACAYSPAGACRYLAAYGGPKRITTWQKAAYLWAPHAPAFVAWVLDPSRDQRRRAA